MGLLIVAALLQQWSTTKPEALLAMEKARSSVATASVEWQVRDHRSRETHRFLNRMSLDGFVFARSTGDSTQFWLDRGDEVWEYREDDLFARAWGAERSEDLLDIRSVGLVPGVNRLPAEWRMYVEAEGFTNEAEYRVEEGDDGLVVTMRDRDDNERMIRWVLDPGVGFQPVACELIYGGDVVSSVHSNYALRGDTFFLSRATYRDSDGAIVAEVAVEDAQINHPDQPLELLPEDIGIGNGVNVHYYRGHPKDEQPPGIFCEGEVLTSAEFQLRQRTVGVKPSPLFAKNFPFLVDEYEQARDARAAGATSGPASPSYSAWRVYTLRFIERHDLNDEQRQKALTILADCEERGRRLAVILLDQPGGADPSKAGKSERRLRLGERLDEVFETQLKPRLDALLTRRQRQVGSP